MIKDSKRLEMQYFSRDDPHIDEKNWNRGVARYTSTKKLLVKRMEEEEIMQISKSLVAMAL